MMYGDGDKYTTYDIAKFELNGTLISLERPFGKDVPEITEYLGRTPHINDLLVVLESWMGLPIQTTIQNLWFPVEFNGCEVFRSKMNTQVGVV